MNAITPDPKPSRAKDYLSGRQYGRPPARYDRELVETGAGTPMGGLNMPLVARAAIRSVDRLKR